MNNNLSNNSSDSLSGEYEMVPETQTVQVLEKMDIDDDKNIGQNMVESKSPTLNYDGDFCDLKNDMTEVIQELDKTKSSVDIMGSSSEYEFIFDGSIEIMPVVDNGFTDIKAELMDAFQDGHDKQNSNNLEDSKSNSKELTSPIPTASKTPTFDTLSPQQEAEVTKKEEEETKTQEEETKKQEEKSIKKEEEIKKQEEQIKEEQKDIKEQEEKTPSTSTPKKLTPDINRVGHSVFYDCDSRRELKYNSEDTNICHSPKIVSPGHCSPPKYYMPEINDDSDSRSPSNWFCSEKQDDMKPEISDSEMDDDDTDQGCTIFAGLRFLGSVNINAPKCEKEIEKHMSELNKDLKPGGWDVSISIPVCSEGSIRVYEAKTKTTNATCRIFEIRRILFYLRGPSGTDDEGCFAFTWTNSEYSDSVVYKCFVFRCQIPEAVNQVSTCFIKVFQGYPPSLNSSVTSNAETNNVMMSSMTLDQSGKPLHTASYEFVVSISIAERVSKESYTLVPKDRSGFKFRCNVDKEVIITVKQNPSETLQPLFIERCFGVLLSPGKLVRQADMQLLDITHSDYKKCEDIPLLSLCPFYIRAHWNTSDKALSQFNYETNKMFLTVAIDLVINGIKEPVRFIIESPCSIFSQNEIRLMDLLIPSAKRSISLRFYLQLKNTDDGLLWEVDSIDPSEDIIEQQTGPSSSSSILKSFSKMVRSASTVSIEDDCPSDYSSDGDEPLLSGTGEVSKDCSQDTLDEWNPVLKEWYDEKRPRGLPPLVRAGIPEALRGKIWQKLASVEEKTDITDMYRTLITKETKCEAVILRDIHRTFPAHKRFKETGGSGQDGLFKVSKAYAVYDREVGYCQGLSFIAASLLIHMPEEDAFTVLVAIMYDYNLRDLYKQGFENLYMRLYQLDRLIKDNLPKLHEHFEKTGVETHMYASQWFLTLFTARFSLHFVFHVLDVFLLDGMPFLFQIALTLLALCESDLRQLDFEGILKYFRVSLPKKFRSAKEAKRMIKMACDRKIKKLKLYGEDFYVNKKNDERLEKESKLTKLYEEKIHDERIKFKTELNEVQLKLDEALKKRSEEEKRNINIVQDYKQIIQRQEYQITKLNAMLDVIMEIVSKCRKCSSTVHEANPPPDSIHNRKIFSHLSVAGPLDPLTSAHQRIRELELELAQAKLAQVEAECKNQELNHQLNTTLNEIHNNKNSWQPWLSKTINTIQERVTTRRDLPTFQSYTNPNHETPEYKEKILPGHSPKQHNKNKIQNTSQVEQHRTVSNRNSVDILPRDRPVLRDTLSSTSLK